MNGKHEVLSITIKPEAVDRMMLNAGRYGGCCINATVKQVDENCRS